MKEKEHLNGNILCGGHIPIIRHIHAERRQREGKVKKKTMERRREGRRKKGRERGVNDKIGEKQEHSFQRLFP
jgi:hypothetical protein